MLATALLYAGSIIIVVWGTAHFFPTGTIVRGFGPISDDNKKIITMEWLAEGVAMCYMGILVLLVTIVTGRGLGAPLIVYLVTAGALLILAVMGWLTYARTPIIPMKLCPWIQTVSALLIIAGVII
jgi:hypothetical protein